VLPYELEGVWRDFMDLAGRRSMGPMGPAPLTYRDLAAWATLTRRVLIQPEIRMLSRLDDCWLASLAKE
jgi:hypothetical protein